MRIGFTHLRPLRCVGVCLQLFDRGTPVIKRLACSVQRKGVLRVRRPQLHQRAEWHRRSISAEQGIRFLHGKRHARVFIQDSLKDSFLHRHDTYISLALDLRLCVAFPSIAWRLVPLDILTWPHLLWLVWKLLIVLKTSLSIRQVIAKCLARIALARKLQLISIQKPDVIEIPGICQRVLRQDDVALPSAGFVEQRRNPPAGVCAAHVDHAWCERPQRCLSVIEPLLRWPRIPAFRYQQRLEDRCPDTPTVVVARGSYLS